MDVTGRSNKTTKMRKAKQTPPLDMKEEREHEAGNPGPSISNALLQGRTADWKDPSDKKAFMPSDQQPNTDRPLGGVTGGTPTGETSEHSLARTGPNWGARSATEDAKRRKICKPPEFSDDEDMVPPMVGGGDSSDEEFIEDRNEEITGQQCPDMTFDTDEDMILSDSTDMPNSRSNPKQQ